MLLFLHFRDCRHCLPSPGVRGTNLWAGLRGYGCDQCAVHGRQWHLLPQDGLCSADRPTTDHFAVNSQAADFPANDNLAAKCSANDCPAALSAAGGANLRRTPGVEAGDRQLCPTPLSSPSMRYATFISSLWYLSSVGNYALHCTVQNSNLCIPWKGNCSASVPIPTLTCLWAIYIWVQELRDENIIILFWKYEASQFHFWEYMNGNQTFILDSHQHFICSEQFPAAWPAVYSVHCTVLFAVDYWEYKF